jgi:hypothetical protein
VVRGRHARVPPARRAHRRRPGLARRRAEDQADPHLRRRDRAHRARAHRGAGLRADGPLPAVAPRRRRRRLGHPAHPGARGLRAPGRRGARSSAASRSSSPRSARSSAPTRAPVWSAWAGFRWTCCASGAASGRTSVLPPLEGVKTDVRPRRGGRGYRGRAPGRLTASAAARTAA